MMGTNSNRDVVVRIKGLVVLTALAGCTAQMVTPARSANSRYAPTNESSRHGLVKYLSDGAGFIVKKRREHAYKQMFENCGGPYRIVAEGQRVEGGVVVTTTTASAEASVIAKGSRTDVSASGEANAASTSADIHFWYIQYECAGSTPPR
jgi:hypothetical protein